MDSGEDTNHEEYYDDEEVDNDREQRGKRGDGDDDEEEEDEEEREWNKNAARRDEELAALRARNRRIQLIEANSPAVFVRELGLKIDATAAPQLRHYSWNLREAGDEEQEYLAWSLSSWQQPQQPLTLTELLTAEQMRKLADVFFHEVHPVYNFVDQAYIDQAISTRWAASGIRRVSYDSRRDSFLCGIAVLGCLFCTEDPQREQLEARLVRIVRLSLEHSCNLSEPTVEHVIGWLLRVIYLRLAGTLQATWMATCTLMHMIETTKLHLEPSVHSSARSVLLPSTDHDQYSNPDPEHRRRILCVAQLFNTWVSIDCGRSPVELRGGSSSLMLPRNSWTEDQRQLWQSSDFLKPNRTRSHGELLAEFERLCSVQPSHPMLLLIQCNIALCICRRMCALRLAVCGDDRFWPPFVILARQSLSTARDLAMHRSPWCHTLNIPFQLSCTFLALDKCDSLAPLNEALDTLQLVVQRYNTKSANDSYRVACCLAAMKHRQRYEELNLLDGILQHHSNTNIAQTVPMPPGTGLWTETAPRSGTGNENGTETGSDPRNAATPSSSFPTVHGPPSAATTAQPVGFGATAGPGSGVGGGGVHTPYTEWSLDFMNGFLTDPYFTLGQFPFAMA